MRQKATTAMVRVTIEVVVAAAATAAAAASLVHLAASLLIVADLAKLTNETDSRRQQQDNAVIKNARVK